MVVKAERLLKTTATGHSLWLVPDGDVLETLRCILAQLAEDFGSPPFEPHVTLVGELSQPLPEIEERARSLTTMLSPLTIRCQRLASDREYFKCVFFTVAKSKALLQANRLATKVFTVPAIPYEPHLSLLYTEVDPETRSGILHRLGHLAAPSFRAESISIVQTEGGVPEWREVYRYSLQGS